MENKLPTIPGGASVRQMCLSHKALSKVNISLASNKEREKPNRLASISIWQKKKKKNLYLYIHVKKPIKAWGNMHCFQIRLNCSKIRSKKKKKRFLQEHRRGCCQAQELTRTSSPSTAVDASWTSVWSAAGSSGAEDWVASSAAISWSTTSKSRPCKSTPEGCLTR